MTNRQDRKATEKKVKESVMDSFMVYLTVDRDENKSGGKGPQHILHVFPPNPRPFCIAATAEVRIDERNCELWNL